MKQQPIVDFLEYYFKKQKNQFDKKELPQHKYLIEQEVIFQSKHNDETIEINTNSTILQKVVLKIAEDKLNRKLPLEFSEAFLFVEEFEKLIKKEYSAVYVNSYDTIIDALKLYILIFLSKEGVDVKKFLLSIDDEGEREGHLFSFEKIFLDFIPYSNYSEKEIFDIFSELKKRQFLESYIIDFFRNTPHNNLKFSNNLLCYALKECLDTRDVANLLIGIYNAGDLSALDKAIDLKKKNPDECFFVLGRIDYKNAKDVEKAYNEIGVLDFENVKVAQEQSYLIANIVANKYTTIKIKESCFRFYAEFLNNGTNEILQRIMFDLRLMKGYEKERYSLLYLYLSKTNNFDIIDEFFSNFESPLYIFDILKRLFRAKPDYRFSTDLFENGIRHSWKTNQKETEKQILDLFKQHPMFGMLGVKVIFSAYLGLHSVDFLKLEKAEYQINAINSICKHPYSFDELLTLILPLRNSKLNGVREHLQEHLIDKVFNSYHELIYNQIKSCIGETNDDKQFLEPIKEALENYNKLKELKESINDLNPYENERDLMDLYYRLEHERNAQLMSEVNKGKGTFMEMAKSVIIVRGNSWMMNEGEISALGKYEKNMLIDRKSYLNPDLYEYNLNTIE